MKTALPHLVRITILLCCISSSFVPPGEVFSQSLSSYDRERGLTMLRIVLDDVKNNYYDKNFRGIDLEETRQQAAERIKQAKSNGEIFAIIARTLLAFNDSHTVFLPPSRTAKVEYGWEMQMFGDKCYVIAVRKKSDAEAQGLKPGDLVKKLDGIAPTRTNLWIFRYQYYALAPRPSVKVEVQSPGEEPRVLELKAKVQTGKLVTDLTGTVDLTAYLRELEDERHLRDHSSHEVGDDVIIWKMPGFDLSKDGVRDRVEKIKGHKILILDLRRNSGGYVDTLVGMFENLFDHDVKIGDVKTRKESKPLVAKSRGKGAYQGEMIVLVDSDSASAAELFARVVQLEKRGKVLGDQTSGKVMRSRVHGHTMGTETLIFYGASVTDADVIMTDGKSLEYGGVTPDQIALPTGEDLSAQRDPVLSLAVSLAGANLDPVAAGKLFPFKWKP